MSETSHVESPPAYDFKLASKKKESEYQRVALRFKAEYTSNKTQDKSDDFAKEAEKPSRLFSEKK